MNENQVIYRFQKNALEQVWIQFSDYMEKPTLDIRVYYRPPGQQEGWLPSRRGISMSRAHLPELIEGLRLAQEKLGGNADGGEDF